MRRILPLIAASLLAFAPAPFPRPERKRADEGALSQGTYELTGYRRADRNELARSWCRVNFFETALNLMTLVRGTGAGFAPLFSSAASASGAWVMPWAASALARADCSAIWATPSAVAQGARSPLSRHKR